MVKLQNKEELVSYFDDVIKVLSAIKNLIQSRNKTTRMKALASITTLTEARVKASRDFARAGGYEEFNLTIQKSIYDPICEFLIEESGK